jgi:hypothetical protein
MEGFLFFFLGEISLWRFAPIPRPNHPNNFPNS